jgi:ribulose-5-phosphate 4-epimerase/fuculose-1-phosphate aldolase
VQKKLDFAGPSHVTSRPPIASVRLATSERLAQKPQTQTKSKKANAAPVVELAPFWYQENELSPDWVKVIPETEESRREQKTLRIKQELANSMKELFENKMIALRDGNVSMKPKGEDRFFITPGGVPKNTLKPEDVCEIPMDVEYTPPKKTGPRPSRETFMHKSVYMAFRERLDANKDMFVVHAHPPAILAYVGVEEGRKKQLSSLKSLFPEFLTTIGPNVPLLEAGSKDLADTCGNNNNNSNNNNNNNNNSNSNNAMLLFSLPGVVYLRCLCELSCLFLSCLVCL